MNGITPRDFYVLIHKIMPDFSKKEIADMFSVMDSDGNNILQKEEFEKQFSVSLKDVVSQKVKSLSWAAPHFSEINQVLVS